ncbi:uncharacterized protein BX664DRAFT_361285 [Halteromyces radiatus]|uniref:uncharacterized protein n=1 Tax=Halteromyces radiatus TaxID=101107 RepID=UPI00222068BE|nr:uncharacterized protein BX664DRAFT_361285 [Halteromyces radiatus]KAI8083009.1 hypothetical protein BX664DRAFT_361285 [Halteromyces radiatus]
MDSTQQNMYGHHPPTSSPPQADFTAEPPKDTKAPWQAPISPKGESTWDHSQASREHPEWYTTAHGTTDRWEQHPPLEEPTSTEQQQKRNHHRRQTQDHPRRFMEYGHTVQHPPSRRSIHRDLNNI